ncbi:hypothetical protein D3C76_1751040 [compost metagenome]
MHQVALVLELDQVEPAKRRGVLVLPAPRDTKAQPLGLKGKLGDLVGAPAVLPQFVEHGDGRGSRRRGTAKA